MNKSVWIVIMASAMIVGCSTVGGTLKGAGEDLSRAGEYIRGVGK